MATQQKRNETKEQIQSAGCMAALFILLAIITIVYVALWLIPIGVPLLFLLGFFSNWIRYQTNDKALAKRKFWLTQKEKVLFENVCRGLTSSRNLKEDVHAAVEREGIHINKNGRISAKSYRGQELQEKLDQAEGFIKDMQPVYQRLRVQPRKQWKRALKRYSKAAGMGIAFLTWAVYIFCNTDNATKDFSYYFSEGKENVTELWTFTEEKDSTKVEQPAKQQSKQEAKHPNSQTTVSKEETANATNNFTEVLIKALFTTLIVFAIAWSVGIIIFIVKHREPPFVDMNNVNSR